MAGDSLSPHDALLRMVEGYRVSQALHVAATLGIADLLADGPKSARDLAQATGSDALALSRLLWALATVGVFKELAGSFQLTPAAEYLRSDVAGSVRARAMYLGQLYFWETWGHLFDSVRTGEPAFPALHGMSAWQYREAHPEANAIFNAAMSEGAAAAAEAIVESYDFSEFDVVADVGGGNGALLAAILEANPALRGILFDQPHVVADAPTLFERVGVAARCEIVAGTFFERAPSGADAYLLKSIVHDWDDAQAARILRTCRAAMGASGKLLVIERVLQPANEPDPARYVDLNMLVMLGGRERTADDFEQLYADAGFRLTRIFLTPSGFSVIEGVPV